MKTAEEWAKTLLIEPIQTNSPWHGNVKAYTEIVRQIQLDAFNASWQQRVEALAKVKGIKI